MGQATEQWEQLQSGMLGPLELHPDGHYAVCGMVFDQEVHLENCTIGNARFDKPSGEGQELKVTAPDRTHFLKYESGMWYYRASKAHGKVRRGLFTKVLLAAAVAFVLWRILS